MTENSTAILVAVIQTRAKARSCAAVATLVGGGARPTKAFGKKAFVKKLATIMSYNPVSQSVIADID